MRLAVVTAALGSAFALRFRWELGSGAPLPSSVARFPSYFGTLRFRRQLPNGSDSDNQKLAIWPKD